MPHRPFQTEPFEATTADGVRLKGMLYIPEHPSAIVQFNCATAASTRFYIPFMEYLASEGFACALWDYRGMGETGPANLKGCTYRFQEYGTQDMPAVKAFLLERFPNLPLWMLGHSSGGQQVGFMPDLEGIAGLLAFSVSGGYAPNFPSGYRRKSAFFFYCFAPLSIALAGYVKSKPFGFMENLPKGVCNEWKAWCSKPNYFFDPAFRGKTLPPDHFDAIPFPIHVFTPTDDEICTRANSDNYWKHVRSLAGITHYWIEPHACGMEKLGHFGLFHRKMREPFWPQVAAVIKMG